MAERNSSKQVNGVFIGLTTMDSVYYISDYPENNTKAKTNHYRCQVGGPAANAAITYALLGGKATLFTCLGSSRQAVEISQILSDYGVEVINCADDDTLPCTAAITVDRLGNRTIVSGQHRFQRIHFPVPENPDFCLFDLNQQELSLKMLGNISCPVVLDAGSFKENTEMFLEKADYVISSESFRNPSGQNVLEMEILKGKEVAVTRGEKDILLRASVVAVPSVECVDSLGAGDIFHGAFCFARFELQKDFRDALEFAARIASESVKQEGTTAWREKVR